MRTLCTNTNTNPLTKKQYAEIVSAMPLARVRTLNEIRVQWRELARGDQLPPHGDWLVWLLLGGRGAGKTRAGAEWIRAQITGGARRIALVAPSYNEAREVMIEGESGLLSIGPARERPVYHSSRRRLEWPSGAVGHVFSAEDPDGLRGPQFDCAWADEFCAWSYPDDTLSNLRLGLRLGAAPRLVITTTPKPIAALKNLMKEERVHVSRAATMDNKQNLSPAFMSAVYNLYGGTRLGRQELGGEILENMQGALWTRSLIERARTDHIPAFDKVIIAIDPPVTSGARSDACGLIVAGRTGEGRRACVTILHDGTVQGRTPEGWAKQAAALWESWDADYILTEANQGGDMVHSVFRAVGSPALVRTVYASKGKTARAEPIAALYEQGRVKHAGSFPKLEDELCLMGADIKGRKSPDRADALVWAVTELLLKPRTNPRIRSL